MLIPEKSGIYILDIEYISPNILSHHLKNQNYWHILIFDFTQTANLYDACHIITDLRLN